ncbi:glycosyltransferase family 4 protein [Candidatus Uhrbacteria bacterium]|nr:glycosyltransferase family 4 protein [Candidatus Uhrbacteria bacterium]
MRIVHAVSTFPPYRGGMGNVAQELALRAIAQGHEVEVVTPGRANGSHAVLPLSPAIPWLWYGNAAWCPGMGRTITRRAPDVVHFHWPFIGGAASVLAWRRRAQGRLIVQFHMDLVAQGMRKWLFGGYQWWSLRRLLSAADRVVVSSWDYACSGALAAHLPKLGSRCVAIPLGVDGHRFAPDPTQSRPRVCTMLFVGGLDRAHAFKGVPVLLDACAMVPDVQLRIVGDGDLRAALQEHARMRGIADRVEFLGAVTADQLPMVYRSVDAVVLPSTARSEAFGLVLLEGMASGVPAIASDLPGVRTVIEEGVTGFLVPPGDVRALAERIRACVIHRSRLREMGARARERVMVSYTWAALAQQWTTLYDDVCHTRG